VLAALPELLNQTDDQKKYVEQGDSEKLAYSFIVIAFGHSGMFLQIRSGFVFHDGRQSQVSFKNLLGVWSVARR
jgi:hypothetical protein